MATQKQRVEFVAEFGEFIKQADLVTKALKNVGIQIEKVTEVSGRFSKQGNRTATAFEAVGKAGEKLTGTLKKTNEELKVSQVRFSGLGESARKLEDAEKKAAAASAAASKKREEGLKRVEAALKKQNAAIKRGQQAVALAAQQRQPFQPALLAASTAELNKVSNAQTRLTQTIIRSSSSIKRAQDIIAQSIREPGRVFAASEQKIAAAARGLNTSLTAAGSAARKFGDAFARGGLRGQKAGQAVLISWQSVARLFITAQIHRLIGLITFAFRDAIRESIRFQIQISEIRTIAQDNQLAFNVWSENVRRLARQFGQTGADVAEAAYQTLSNQVAKGTETFEFLTTALRLSKAATGTTEDAVNLLTSAINSFGLQTSDAERVAGILFKTVELGRIRLGDLANSFGRVGQTAALAGISLEETVAALQVLTISGLGATRASTFLINLLKGIIKPSTALREAFDRLGISSGTTLLSTQNLVGTLRILQNEFKGNADELAKLFPNLRGFQGVAGLTGDALLKLADGLEKTIQSGVSFNKAVPIAFESAGKTISVEINKIRISFTEFGDTVTKVVVAITKPLGGLSNTFNIIVKSLAVVTAGFIGFGLAAAIAASSAITLIGVIGGLGTGFAVVLGFLAGPVGIVTLLAAAAAAWFVFGESSEEALERNVRALDRSFAERKRFVNNITGIETAARIKRINEEAKANEKIFQGRAVFINDVITLLEEDQRAITQSLQLAIDGQLSLFRTGINELKSELSTLQSIAKTSANFILSITNRINAAILNIRSAEASVPAQIQLVRAALASAESEQRRLAAIDITDPKVNILVQKQVIKLRLQQVGLAERLGRLIKQNNDERIRGLDQNQKLQERADKQTAAIQERVRRRAIQIRLPATVAQTVVAQTRFIARQQKLIRQQRLDREKIAQIGRDTLKDTVKVNDAIGGREQIVKRLITLREEGIAQEQRRLKLVEKQREIRKKELAELEKQTNEANKIFKTLVKFEIDREKVPLVVALTSEELKKQQNEAAKAEVKVFEEKKKKLLTLDKLELKDRLELFKFINQRQAKLEEQALAFIIDKKIKAESQFNALNQKQLVKNARELEDVRKKAEIRIIDQQQKGVAAINTLVEATERSIFEGPGARGRVIDLSKAAIEFKNIAARLKTIALSTESVGAEQEAEVRRLFARFKELGSILRVSAETIQIANTAFTTGITERRGIAILEQAAAQRITEEQEKQLKLARIRANILEKITPQTPVLTEATGGLIRRAKGGFGTDSVNALLTPGEFVVNAASSKRFRNQLMRMNSGLPQRFQGGGNVRNVDVGGINVTVQGGDTSESTIAAIGKGLRREIRRGRLSL